MPDRARRTLRVIHYNPWAEGLEDALTYVGRLPSIDLGPRIAEPGNVKMKTMARLDADWHGESTRCFASLEHPDIDFLPALVLGRQGFSELLSIAIPPGEEWWFVTNGQHPSGLEHLAGKVFGALAARGIRILYYAFDEASRAMPCFAQIAPHLSVLIHDESPLDPAGQARLSPRCLVRHRSWVANLVPFSAPLVEEPGDKLVFLGSEMGLTPHRQRQVAFLRETFKDRFVAIHDHSLAVGDRTALGARFKASLCPEGRKFTTPAMARTHTDRPFWSGCLGLVPVSENSRQGGRLDELAAEGLLVRYAHGDLKSLREACEQALATPTADRRRMYDHYNRHETVGPVVVDALLAAP